MSIRNAEGPIENLANATKESSVLHVEKNLDNIVIDSGSDVGNINVMSTTMEGVEVLQKYYKHHKK